MSRKLSIFKVSSTVLLIAAFATSSLAQTAARDNSSNDSAGGSSAKPDVKAAAAVNPKYTTPKSPLDTAYGAKIAEYTTEKYFLTELVDPLPLSDKVPSPQKV